jgi:tetratricopeptide (TPR) repeat protein
MKGAARLIVILGLVLAGTADILIFVNGRLFDRSEKVDDPGQRIDILKKANGLYAFNDLAFYGLGKAYLDLGKTNPAPADSNRVALEQAAAHLRRAIRLNPTSPFFHFYYARSLFELSFLSDVSKEVYLGEFRKAANLAAPSTEIFFEVGRTFLSFWPELTDNDRNYALGLVQKIFEEKDKPRTLALFNTWELNSGDFAILEPLLPTDGGILRLYANFLGEKSLSIEDRQKALAKTEYFEFMKVKSDIEAGERAVFARDWEAASRTFESCRERLGRIAFYQNLSHQDLIPRAEFDDLYRSNLLSLAKCRLEQERVLASAEDELREYLRLEARAAKVAELEAFLKARRLIPERRDDQLSDLHRLSFLLMLDFKQKRYAETMKVANLLKTSFVLVPESMKTSYVQVLQTIGDTCQQLGSTFEAGDFYQKALEADPKNLETLVRLRQIYLALSLDDKAQEVNTKIGGLLSSQLSSGYLFIEKWENLSRTVRCDGQKVVLNLGFSIEPGLSPLISIFFNGQVVWENYLPEGSLALPLQTMVGENILHLRPLNRPVTLLELACAIEKPDELQAESSLRR